MLPIDYSRLSDSSKQLLNHANTLARESHFDEVSCALVLIAMVQQSKEMLRFVLDKLNVDYNQFCTRLSGYMQNVSRFNNDNPLFAEPTNRVIVNAISSYCETQRGLVPPEAFLLEMASTRNDVTPLFDEFHLSKRRLSEAINSYAAGNRINTTDEEEHVSLTNLEKYAVNLRKLAADGDIESTIGRDDEIRRILQIVSRKTKTIRC